MKTLRFELEFEKLDGFSEKDFLDVIRKNLEEIDARGLRYHAIENGYLFEVDFVPLLASFSYQPILGCFSDLAYEYPKIKNVGMPGEKIFLSNAD